MHRPERLSDNGEAAEAAEAPMRSVASSVWNRGVNIFQEATSCRHHLERRRFYSLVKAVIQNPKEAWPLEAVSCVQVVGVLDIVAAVAATWDKQLIGSRL